MRNPFPRTEIAGVSVPRLIVGCNWISGYSHQSFSMDTLIKRENDNARAAAKIFAAFLRHDINAVLGLFNRHPSLVDAVREAEEAAQKKMILFDEPILNMDDNADARRAAELEIRKCAANGATFCMPLHASIEKLIDKNKRTIPRLPDYLDMIRQAGMIPGLSAHMPEVLLYTDENQYDVEVYIQIYNCVGFMMHREVEEIARIIHGARKPVITIKPCAAGRISPYVGLNFSFSTIREKDMVAIGCFDAREAREDIEYSLAAIERRFPNQANRESF